MRTHFIIFTAIFGLFLTACTKSEPKEVVQNKENPAINEPIENTEDIPKSNDCIAHGLQEFGSFGVIFFLLQVLAAI